MRVSLTPFELRLVGTALTHYSAWIKARPVEFENPLVRRAELESIEKLCVKLGKVRS